VADLLVVYYLILLILHLLLHHLIPLENQHHKYNKNHQIHQL
jgi:hypothetical protein